MCHTNQPFPQNRSPCVSTSIPMGKFFFSGTQLNLENIFPLEILRALFPVLLRESSGLLNRLVHSLSKNWRTKNLLKCSSFYQVVKPSPPQEKSVHLYLHTKKAKVTLQKYKMTLTSAYSGSSFWDLKIIVKFKSSYLPLLLFPTNLFAACQVGLCS